MSCHVDPSVPESARGDAVLDDDVVELERALVEDAAAERALASPVAPASPASCATPFWMVSPLITTFTPDADLEDAVESAAVDDRRAGALALDGDRVAGAGQVEVALRRGVLLAGGVGDRELIGAGLEDDRVVLPVAVGRDDGGAERVRGAVGGGWRAG